MTLVESPVALHWNPVAISGIKGKVCRVDSAAKQRGVKDVGEDAFLLQEFAAVNGFLLT